MSTAAVQQRRPEWGLNELPYGNLPRRQCAFSSAVPAPQPKTPKGHQILNPDGSKRLRINSSQIPPPEICPFLQEYRGFQEIILRFFQFFAFFGTFPVASSDLQLPTTIQPLQKKSCQKTDGRFSIPSGICHNRRMDVEMTYRIEGCKGWTLVKHRPSLRAKRFGVRNGSSAFGHPAGNCRGRARLPNPAGLSATHHAQSNLITPNQTEALLPTRFDQAGWRTPTRQFLPPRPPDRLTRSKETRSKLN